MCFPSYSEVTDFGNWSLFFRISSINHTLSSLLAFHQSLRSPISHKVSFSLSFPRHPYLWMHFIHFIAIFCSCFCCICNNCWLHYIGHWYCWLLSLGKCLRKNCNSLASKCNAMVSRYFLSTLIKKSFIFILISISNGKVVGLFGSITLIPEMFVVR